MCRKRHASILQRTGATTAHVCCEFVGMPASQQVHTPMHAGEYIAVEKVEAALKACPYVEQVCICVNVGVHCTWSDCLAP